MLGLLDQRVRRDPVDRLDDILHACKLLPPQARADPELQKVGAPMCLLEAFKPESVVHQVRRMRKVVPSEVHEPEQRAGRDPRGVLLPRVQKVIS